MLLEWKAQFIKRIFWERNGVFQQPTVADKEQSYYIVFVPNPIFQTDIINEDIGVFEKPK